MYPVRALATALLIVSTASAADPGVWPQWRGPTRDGVVTGEIDGASATQDTLLRMMAGLPTG